MKAIVRTLGRGGAARCRTTSGPTVLGPTVLGMTLLALGGCAPTVATHGWRLDPAAVAQIQPGKSTEADVQRLLGSPSSVATFDNDAWFYVNQKTEVRSFYQSKVESQDVLRVDFNRDGVVADVKQHDLAMAENIEPAPEKTRTMGNELTLVQQFIGNIGRFNSGPAADSATSRAASAARRGIGGGGG